ncbi:MAG: hypothetical protein MHPSP_001303, partial [Paramarteilia canceri]
DLMSCWNLIDTNLRECLLKKFISDKGLSEAANFIKSIENGQNLFKTEQYDNCGKTYLVLSSNLLFFPFEAISTFKNQTLSRFVSYDHLIKHLSAHSNNQAYAFKDISVSNDLFYLINPDGTLGKCQNRMESFFHGQLKCFKGSIGIFDKLKSFNYNRAGLLVYCGHGDGKNYIQQVIDSMEKSISCCSFLLFGCSSIKLHQEPRFDCEGLAMTLISLGTPVVGGFLWQIFDSDSDNFTTGLLNKIFAENLNFNIALNQTKNTTKFRCLSPSSFVIYGSAE